MKPPAEIRNEWKQRPDGFACGAREMRHGRIRADYEIQVIHQCGRLPKIAQRRCEIDEPRPHRLHRGLFVFVRLLKAEKNAPIDIGQGNVPWAVMADPEGNELCVLEPRDIYRDTGPVAAVVADCASPLALRGFWELASGWTVHESTDQFVSFRSPQGLGPYFELMRNPDQKTVKNRMHLDVAPFKGDDHAAAVKELKEAGAVDADVGQGDESWTVLADPEGGEFCVLSPR